MGGGGRGSIIIMHSRTWSYDHRPSLPESAGAEHVGFSPTRQTPRAPSAKRRKRDEDTATAVAMALRGWRRQNQLCYGSWRYLFGARIF